MGSTTKKAETSQSVKPKVISVENTDMKDLMEQMKLLIEENKKIKEQMEKIQNDKTPTSSVQNHQANVDREVSFVSLHPGILNLSTEGRGQGQIYTFEEFGQEHKIPYSEAKLILKNQAHFAKDGYFYIDDAELIKTSQLTNAYKRILDQNGLENLFIANQETFDKVFKGIPKVQQEIFADLITQKLYKKQSVDMNIVMKVSDITKRDLVAESKGDREIFESK
jgi:hypothetical protein